MVLPGMSDGRCFTNYMSNCQFNSGLMAAVDKPFDNNGFRQYLQTNATELMKTYADVCSNNCEDCVHQPLKQKNRV